MLKRGCTSKGELKTNIGRCPPWTNHSYCPPFPQQTAVSQAKSREQTADHNQRTVQRGSTFLTLRAWEMQPRHRPQFDSFPTTDSCLQIGLMPGRTRRVQPRRFRLAFLPPWQPTVPRIKQPPRTPHSYNHSVDRHHCWSTHERWLRTSNDRKHNLRRLAEKIEFHQRFWGPHPSHHPDQISTSSCNTLPLEQN